MHSPYPVKSVNCKLCDSESVFRFKRTLLGSHEVSYYQCQRCDFLQTETPHWLEEAYSNAIAKLDVGLVHRNLTYAPLVSDMIARYFDADGSFLDYGGGYGLFVRIMRDRGLDFRLFDQYCENLFARGFELAECGPYDQFELMTTFEVFEHLVRPLDEIEKMLSFTDSILFSTELSDGKQLDDWWYLTPESGQHISFYSKKSLKHIAEHFKLNLYSNDADFHLLTKKLLPDDLFEVKQTYVQKKILRFARWLQRVANDSSPQKRASLLPSDFEQMSQRERPES